MLGVLAAAVAMTAIDGRELDRFIEQKMAVTQVPGVAVGIYHNGETYTAGFGITNFDHPLRVTDETLFQVGSITKTFTGTIIMRLVEQGKLDLDAKVRSYLPDFRVDDENASSQATVRHLLTHMGGWAGDYFDDTGTGADALPIIVDRMSDLEQLAPIGTVYSYNNAGFYVAGLLIETVAGKSYEDVLHEMVLEPLEIEGCEITPRDVMTHRFAVGHGISDENGVEVMRPWYLARAAFPAGGLVCDVEAMLRYARFHLGDGRALFEGRTLREMHTTQFEKVGTDDEMAITWHATEVDGTRILGHGGGTLGQISLLQFVPERDFAIAIVTNAGRGGRITRDVSRWALKEYLGLEITDPEPMSPQPDGLDAYVGTYRRPFADVEVRLDDDVLVLQTTIKQGFPTKDSPIPPPPPPARFQLYEKDRLVRIDGPATGTTAEFVRNENGSIGWLRSGGRIHIRDEMFAFITGLPKAELHLHLEGSLAPQTVVDLAVRNGVDSFETIEEVGASLANREPGLIGFLNHYNEALKVLKTRQDFYQATYDLLEICHDNGIVYIELSFDPQAHTSRGVPFDDIINGIDQGRRAAAKDFDIETNLIMAMNRERSAESALDMLERAAPHRDKILGIGLDSGPEDGNPPSKFEAVYARAREEGYRLTIHCDVHQRDTLPHMWEALDLIRVDRIDHGLNAIEDPKLVGELKRRRVCLTACPVQRSTDPEPQDLDLIRGLFDAGVCVSLNTDDPAQFDSGYLVNLVSSVQQAGGYSAADIVQFVIYGFESSFLSRSAKDAYIATVKEYAAAR